MFAAEAKQRQKAGGKSAGNGRQKKVMVNLPEPTSTSRDAAGAALNVSGSLVDRAAVVLEKGSKDLIAKVEAGEGVSNIDPTQ